MYVSRMTAQEKLDFEVLSLLLYAPKYISSTDLQEMAIPTVGNGVGNIVAELVKRGLVESHSYTIGTKGDYYNEFGHVITNAGKLYCESLIKGERKEKRLYRIFVWTLIAAIIGAIAATLVIVLK